MNKIMFDVNTKVYPKSDKIVRKSKVYERNCFHTLFKDLILKLKTMW